MHRNQETSQGKPETQSLKKLPCRQLNDIGSPCRQPPLAGSAHNALAETKRAMRRTSEERQRALPNKEGPSFWAFLSRNGEFWRRPSSHNCAEKHVKKSSLYTKAIGRGVRQELSRKVRHRMVKERFLKENAEKRLSRLVRAAKNREFFSFFFYFGIWNRHSFFFPFFFGWWLTLGGSSHGGGIDPTRVAREAEPRNESHRFTRWLGTELNSCVWRGRVCLANGPMSRSRPSKHFLRNSKILWEKEWEKQEYGHSYWYEKSNCTKLFDHMNLMYWYISWFAVRSTTSSAILRIIML